jgi:hypothetical protein
MIPPQGYKGPALDVILRTTKPDNMAEVVPKVFESLGAGAKKVAIFQKD